MLRFLLAVPEMGTLRRAGWQPGRVISQDPSMTDPHRCRCCGGPQLVSLPTVATLATAFSCARQLRCGGGELYRRAQGLRPMANTRRTGDCVPLGPGEYARRSSGGKLRGELLDLARRELRQ